MMITEVNENRKNEGYLSAATKPLPVEVVLLGVIFLFWLRSVDHHIDH